MTSSKPADSGDDGAQKRGDGEGGSANGGVSSGGGGGSAGGGAVPLSLAARASLSQLDPREAKELERVATSPQLGAPRGRVEALKDSARTAQDEPSLPSAVISAASEGWGILALLVLTVATTTIVALTAAGYERRQHRRVTG